MRAVIISLLICFCLRAAFCESAYSDDFIVTSADLRNGVVRNVGNAGESYRLYGLSAAYTFTPLTRPALQKITIADSNGTTFKLTDLRDTDSVDFFLSDTNIVVGPVTITDPNPQEGLAGLPASTQIPFTIYLVSESEPLLPVADGATAASHMSLNSRDYNQTDIKGFTILSAEPFLTLYQFAISDEAYMTPRGYASSTNWALGDPHSLLDLRPNTAENSQVTVIGPIISIVFLSKTGRISLAVNNFELLTAPKWTMLTDSSLTVTSPNWKNYAESYSTSWIDYKPQLDQQFSYGSDRLLDFTLSVSGLANDQNITVEVKSDNGDTRKWSYLPTTKDDVRDTVYGNSIHLKAAVDYKISPSAYPNFILKITSGTSTISFLASVMFVLCFLIQ